MPSSKSSSAICGVIPKPPAAFSPLAMVRSTPCCACSSGNRSCTMLRPTRAKMSPTKRMRESLRQRCSTQKVVIACRIQLDAVHAVGMHQYVFEIPQVDIGKVFRDDLLDFIVDGLALLLIESTAAFANQLVQSRIRVEGAVVTTRRKTG